MSHLQISLYRRLSEMKSKCRLWSSKNANVRRSISSWIQFVEHPYVLGDIRNYLCTDLAESTLTHTYSYGLCMMRMVYFGDPNAVTLPKEACSSRTGAERLSITSKWPLDGFHFFSTVQIQEQRYLSSTGTHLPCRYSLRENGGDNQRAQAIKLIKYTYTLTVIVCRDASFLDIMTERSYKLLRTSDTVVWRFGFRRQDEWHCARQNAHSLSPYPHSYLHPLYAVLKASAAKKAGFISVKEI